MKIKKTPFEPENDNYKIKIAVAQKELYTKTYNSILRENPHKVKGNLSNCSVFPLGHIKLVIFALLPEQFLMGSAFFNDAFIDVHDPVAVLDG